MTSVAYLVNNEFQLFAYENLSNENHCRIEADIPALWVGININRLSGILCWQGHYLPVCHAGAELEAEDVVMS